LQEAHWGALSGPFVKDWFDRRTLRRLQRQTRRRPLLEAARGLAERWKELSERYSPDRPEESSIALDFVELYTLRDRAPIEDLEEDALHRVLDESRHDGWAVQRVRRRMSHQLNYAASSLYLTGRYLGYAEPVLRDLKDGRLLVLDSDADEMTEVISGVRREMQGTSKDHPGVSIIWEQQQSIAESMWGADDRLIGYPEFRRKLLEPVGWEQFTGLFRFFVHFHKKRYTEVARTNKAVEDLIDSVGRIRRWAA
jgi:hypothetical protein